MTRFERKSEKTTKTKIMHDLFQKKAGIARKLRMFWADEIKLIRMG